MATGRNVKNCNLFCGDSFELKTGIKEHDERPEWRAVDWLKSLKNCIRIAAYYRPSPYNDETPAVNLGVTFRHSRYLSFNKLNKLKLVFGGKFTDLRSLTPSRIYERTAAGDWVEYQPQEQNNETETPENINEN